MQRNHDLGLIVTGASGWIGRAVVSNARLMGYAVVATSKSMEDAPSAMQVKFDLQDDETRITNALEQFLPSASRWALIHCAGLAHVRSETPQLCELLQRTNADGTEKLVRVCARLGLQRFVYTSSISVYAWDSGQQQNPRTELDAVRPRTEYGRTKLHGERVVMQSQLDWHVARLATVFGPGDTANFFRLAKAIKSRRFFIPGRGRQRKSCIDVETAARSLIAMATIPAPARRVVNVAFPETPTLAEIATSLAAACSVPSPLGMPESLLRLLARCGDLGRRLGLPAPLTTDDLSRLCGSTWVDSSLALAIVPDLATKTFADAMKQAAAYYRLS